MENLREVGLKIETIISHTKKCYFLLGEFRKSAEIKEIYKFSVLSKSPA